MVALPFPVYDADHHLYEPAEAFLRHLPKAFHKDFYFAEVNGRTKLVIDGQLSEYIPNPTFEVVAAPGTHEIWYRAENHEGKSLRELTGKALRPPPEWRAISAARASARAMAATPSPRKSRVRTARTTTATGRSTARTPTAPGCSAVPTG